MRQAYPAAAVSVWAQDEHRLGLLPVIRRMWAPQGQRPTAHVQRQYRWLYVSGFVRPPTGQSWWGLLPTVTTSASLERQPAERLWGLVDEPVANQAFPDVPAPQAVLVDRCRTLAADLQRLKAHTCFH